ASYPPYSLPSNDRRFLVQRAFGKPLRAQRREIQCARASIQDHLRRELAYGGSVHHAMTAESVREEETLYLRRPADDSMVIGRDLVQPRVAGARIDRGLLEAAESMAGHGQHFAEECRF